MFSPLSVLFAIFAYVAVLFLLAQFGERTARGRRWAAHPAVYALGLAVYCTTWTYYGSVGKASTGGMGFLPVYLGPTLALLLGGSIFERIVRLKQAHRITSVADFISARYGKSQAVAATVTLLLMVGIVPYVGLQLKALTSTFAALTTSPGGDVSTSVAWFTPVSAVLMIVFTIVFGIRHLDPTERHPGMVFSLAAESIIKLVAFVSAGVFIVGLAFGDTSTFFEHFAANPPALPMMGKSDGNQILTWCTVGLLSMSAFVFLPRQFHVGVVESVNPKHVRTARWMTPLYLILINLFVVPIALGGKHMALAGVSGDQFVLALPIHAGASALSMAVFIGGFSAAIGMIMIESMTMATMISNHLLMPLIQAIPALSGLKRQMLYARWLSAAIFIGAGYLFEVGIGGSYMLVAIGLISFASAFLLTPIIIGGLYWRAASKGGALLGLGLGFVTWFYTLLMPTFVKSGWMSKQLLTDGPWGLYLLRPEALLGFEGLPALSHGVMWSAGITITGYIVGSIVFPANKEERQLTEQFLDIDADQFGHLDNTEATISAEEKRLATAELLKQFYPQQEIPHLVKRCFDKIGCQGAEMLTVVQFAELYNEVERTLCGALGAASAHGVMKEQWGTIDRKATSELALEYARMMAHMKLSPKEIKQRIDYQAERESLLTSQFQELKKHNDMLEDKVLERTHEIQTILDNVTFGFLVVGHDMRVREGFTQSCHELLHVPIKTGANLCDLLGISSAKARAHFELSFDQIYEDIMPEEMLTEQLPNRFEQPNGKVLRTEARIIRDAAHQVEALLLTISDITQLESAQRESQQNRVLISLLQQKEAFSTFLQDTNTLLQNARNALKSDEVLVRRVVHTIKGNTAIYGIEDIAQLIHEIEDNVDIGTEELDLIHDAFRAFLQSNEEILRLDFDNLSGSGAHLSKEHMDALRKLLQHTENTSLRQYHKWAAQVLLQPASQLLGPLHHLVDRLAARLGKEVQLVIHGAEVRVDTETVRPIFQNITHLLRNSLDHGIEAPWERENKPEQATIKVTIADLEHSWEIKVEDDGRGIDTKKILAKALQKGLISQAEASRLSEDEILQLIFLDGLSSSDTTTDVSGRGVGMSSVKSAVEDLGGQIQVQSTLGQGTCFTQRIPKPQVASLAA